MMPHGFAVDRVILLVVYFLRLLDVIDEPLVGCNPENHGRFFAWSGPVSSQGFQKGQTSRNLPAKMAENGIVAER